MQITTNGSFVVIRYLERDNQNPTSIPNQVRMIRQEAQARIDHLLNQHRQSIYRKDDESAFATQSSFLAQQLEIVHGGDVEKIVASLHSYANEIAELELSDLNPNGHHERAADAIRRRAATISLDTCPWRDLVHLMANSPTQREFAKVLWEENRRYTDQWSVDLSTLAEAVWGDPLTEQGTIRTAATRLTTWLLENGVTLEITVNASHDPPFLDCQLHSVDETKIASMKNPEHEKRKLELQEKAKAKPAKKSKTQTDSLADLARIITLGDDTDRPQNLS